MRVGLGLYRHMLTRENYDKVLKDMTEDELLKLLGGPSNRTVQPKPSGGDFSFAWSGKEGANVSVLLLDGKEAASGKLPQALRTEPRDATQIGADLGPRPCRRPGYHQIRPVLFQTEHRQRHRNDFAGRKNSRRIRSG